jgi:hypothetical protein
MSSKQEWIELRDGMFSDVDFVKFNQKRDEERLKVQAAILQLLDKFQNDSIDLEEFRSTFDVKTRTEWDVFGLKGTSGAMFLNILVKHIPPKTLIPKLKTAFMLPETEKAGKEQMLEFQNFLQEIIENGIMTRGRLQPARLSFLLSSFWHLQAPNIWPIFYLSARQTLQAMNSYQEKGDATEDYFRYRTLFQNLTQTLQLSSWEFEHLCVWYKDRNIQVVPPSEPEKIVLAEKPQLIKQDEVENSKHNQIQLLLAKIGRKFNYKVWIASNDKNRIYAGERLGDYSIPDLPYLNGVSPKSQRMIELIDVLWLKSTGSKIIAAFEVESTTSIYSGLLRMSDLKLALDNLTFPVYIAVPQNRTQLVQEQLSRNTFQHLELHEICRYFSFEDLFNEADNIMRWASDYTAMDKISKQVGATKDENY